MPKQKQKSKDKRQLSEANADGCILPLNLPDELMSRAATKCPILHNGGKSGERRGLRHIALNDLSRLTSKAILRDLKEEIQKQLIQGGITAPTRMSNVEWVLAGPNTRNKQCGQKHRDTPHKVPGYLTVLIFFGQRKERGYGSALIWRNSSNFMPDDLYIPNDNENYHNHARQLKKLDGDLGLTVNLKEYNCVVFDSRLILRLLRANGVLSVFVGSSYVSRGGHTQNATLKTTPLLWLELVLRSPPFSSFLLQSSL